MKFTKTDFLLVIIIILAGYNLFQIDSIKTNVEFYNNKIDSIQNEIDSVMLINEELTEQIGAIDSEINSIDGDIDKVTKNITIIKNQTNEKTDAVNNFSYDELNKFFTNRYQARYDSTTKGTNSQIRY